MKSKKITIRQAAMAAAGLFFILAICWNIMEICMYHGGDTCGQLMHMTAGDFWRYLCKDREGLMGKILHFFYHSMENSSFTDATYLLALFALAIAAVQIVLPYRHTRVCNYPVYKLEMNPIGSKIYWHICICTLIVLITDLVKLYVVQYISVLYSFFLMFYVIRTNLMWFQSAEKVPVLFRSKFRRDFQKVFLEWKGASQDRLQNCKTAAANIESSMELIECLSASSKEDIEARLALKEVFSTPWSEVPMQVFGGAKKGADAARRICFVYACYITSDILKENAAETAVGDSWYFRLLEKTLEWADYDCPGGEAVTLGILCGMITGQNKDLYAIMESHVLKTLQTKLRDDQFVDVLSVLCAFSELYFRMNNNGLYDLDSLFRSDYFLNWEWTKKIRSHISCCLKYYTCWMEMEVLDCAEPFSTIELALDEIDTADGGDYFPQTVLGKIKYILGGGRT